MASSAERTVRRSARVTSRQREGGGSVSAESGARAVWSPGDRLEVEWEGHHYRAAVVRAGGSGEVEVDYDADEPGLWVETIDPSSNRLRAPTATFDDDSGDSGADHDSGSAQHKDKPGTAQARLLEERAGAYCCCDEFSWVVTLCPSRLVRCRH